MSECTFDGPSLSATTTNFRVDERKKENEQRESMNQESENIPPELSDSNQLIFTIKENFPHLRRTNKVIKVFAAAEVC